ncbi:MAG: winged helix DNA-binding protein [Hyphomonadaceae bacterium]|nr:winged helix DNA-binding protein [Clostridia bacterium]
MDSAPNALNDLLVDTFNEILKIEQMSLQRDGASDCSITEVHTIEAIGLEGKHTMSEVAAILKITTGTLTSSVNKLTAKGYVVRKQAKEDRRMVRIGLTHKGRLIYNRHLAFHEKMLAETLNGLNEEEQRILTHAMTNVKNFFESQFMTK